MDDRLQDAINGLAGHVAFVDSLLKFAAQDLIFVMAPLLVALWLWPSSRDERALNQRVALTAVLAAIVALIAGGVVGTFYQHARPFVDDASTRVLVAHSADNGFPSDHAVVAFAVAGAIVWRRALLGFVVCLIALLIGFARVYVGVHWPIDIVGAAAIGILAGSLASLGVQLLIPVQFFFSRYLPPTLLSAPSVQPPQRDPVSARGQRERNA